MNILFWIIITIIGILLGIFLFLLIGSIRTKAHNPGGATKVIATILVTSLLGFVIFGWNTYSLFSSIDNFNINLPNTQTKTPTETKQNTNTNNQKNNTNDYYNF
jgi:Na+/proline symporter